VKREGAAMTKFSDLLEPSSEWPPDEQRRAGEVFPSLVAQSLLALWRPGDPIPRTGMRLLIGAAASYSRYDLELLDRVNDTLRQRGEGPDHLRVDVFDMSRLHDQSCFDDFIPGLRPVQVTPVVGLWDAGELVRKEQGAAARTFIAALLDL
jgi:hypothetical protein